MANILLAFVTGLTTGGLSCLAVQGGLLASSLAGQIEKDLQNAPPPTARRKRMQARRTHNRIKLAQPILAFLTSKIVAYTLLGFLLGLVGQMFQLSLATRAFLQIAIGIFMLGSALRMLNVHPIFRYFAFEPPAFLRRKLRRTAAGATDASLGTPIFLGLLTVLIPCGITQAMMAIALGTADPIQGASLMFAFTLGTSPVFFAVAYFATQLGSKLEKNFMRFVAVVVLILAVITIDSGVTLAGSPYSLTRTLTGLIYPQQVVQAAKTQEGIQAYLSSPYKSDLPETANTAGQVAGNGEIVTINVKNNGYEPGLVHAKAGTPVKLRLVSKNVRSCSRAFTIPALNLQQILDSTGETIIEIPAQARGTRMPFSCSMGMYGGMIVFDL